MGTCCNSTMASELVQSAPPEDPKPALDNDNPSEDNPAADSEEDRPDIEESSEYIAQKSLGKRDW